MKAFTKFVAGGLGLAAMAASVPAAAQYGGYPGGGYGYPGGGYPSSGYPGGGYGGNPVGDILGQLLGGRSYASNDRYAVEQCVRAVEYRINTRGLDNDGGRYGNYAYGQGYNNRYGNGYAGARVTSVTQVSHRSNGGLKVYGYATTGVGAYGGQGYGQYGYGNQGYGYDRSGYGNYGYNQAQGDAQFNCSIDRNGRITDIDANRSNAYGYRRY
jgi:heterogeneous nuclear ribonucleoprotein A1/A3